MILGTNEYLNKLKISDSNLCSLCGNQSESIMHLFSDCIESNELWINVKNWIKIQFHRYIYAYIHIFCASKVCFVQEKRCTYIPSIMKTGIKQFPVNNIV